MVHQVSAMQLRVVDFGDVISSGHKQESTDDCCIEPGQFTKPAVSAVVLDSVTSRCTDDDNSDMGSSISSLECPELEEGRRSIFSRYWNVDDEEKKDDRHSHSSTTPVQPVQRGHQRHHHVKEAEHRCPVDEQQSQQEMWDHSDSTIASSTGRKPSTFSRHIVYQRGPLDFCMMPFPLPAIAGPRKARSASALLDLPPQSILRDGEEPKKVRRSHSVTFDTTVDVILYDKSERQPIWTPPANGDWGKFLLSCVGVDSSR